MSLIYLIKNSSKAENVELQNSKNILCHPNSNSQLFFIRLRLKVVDACVVVHSHRISWSATMGLVDSYASRAQTGFPVPGAPISGIPTA